MNKERPKRELKRALQACIDLLEDIRHGLSSPVDAEIENLYNWHPLIKEIGGHQWYWDSESECWIDNGNDEE